MDHLSLAEGGGFHRWSAARRNRTLAVLKLLRGTAQEIYAEPIRGTSLRTSARTSPSTVWAIFKARLMNERFLIHLPTCSACRAVILYLEKQSRIDRCVRGQRN
jgi:hypothetical protein